MKETKIIYRKNKELLTEVYSLTFSEVSRITRAYMDATLRGDINDADSSNKWIEAKLTEITL